MPVGDPETALERPRSQEDQAGGSPGGSPGRSDVYIEYPLHMYKKRKSRGRTSGSDILGSL